MYHQFSSEDLARLLRLASRLTSNPVAGPTQALDVIESALDRKRTAGAATTDGDLLIVFTERLRKVRSRRNEMVGTSAFRDPAWDMALDLLVAHHRGIDMSVSSLCAGSGVPQTTALRHIERMEASDMIERHPDPHDHRRIFVRLKPDVAPRLQRVVASLHACLDTDLVSRARKVADPVQA